MRWVAWWLAALLLLSGCGEKALPRKREAVEIPPPVNRLVFGGDVMLSRHVAARARAAGDAALQFRKIAEFFAGADLAFVNLESPFSDKGVPAGGGMIFKAPPAAIAGLNLAGIDVVSTANNHTRDQGEYGLTYTMDLLEKSKIAWTGTGRDEAGARRGVVLTSNAVKFGFLGYTYDQSNGNHRNADERINGMDIVRLREDIAEIRKHSNVTVVSMHAGTEYAKAPHGGQEQFARAAIEAGATLVIGHHPHVVQPCEEYQTGVICYSLGNLIFDQTQPGTNDGLVVEAEFKGFSLRRLRKYRVRIVDTVPELVRTAP